MASDFAQPEVRATNSTLLASAQAGVGYMD